MYLVTPTEADQIGCSPSPARCFMASPAAVADLVSVEWYKSQWPSIPDEELDASAVDLPHEAVDGTATSTKVLMHKKRVSRAALAGKEPVAICNTCYHAYKGSRPELSKTALRTEQLLVAWASPPAAS